MIIQSGQGGGGGTLSVSAVSSAHATTDITVSSADPTWTDLTGDITVSGTDFLLMGGFAAIADGQNTPRIRVLVDTAAVDYYGSFGSDSSSGAGVACSINAPITGLSAGSHTFKLQASYSGTTGFTVHASSNKTKENAWLTVIKLS